MYKPHNTECEYVHEYTRTDGRLVKGHYRAPKTFIQNKWIDVPKRIRRNDPEFIKYNQWRIANGLTDLY